MENIMLLEGEEEGGGGLQPTWKRTNAATKSRIRDDNCDRNLWIDSFWLYVTFW